ncbi:ADP-ribosyltransferase-containing protein [Mailhella sp.]
MKPENSDISPFCGKAYPSGSLLKNKVFCAGNFDKAQTLRLLMPSYREMGTESPFFKAWFGNSKVVDEDGLPLPVYHGTTENFDVFDPAKSRASMDIQGSFFSPWRDDARGYGDNVREFYLSFQNPADSGTAYKSLKSHHGENYAGISAREDLIKAGYDSVNNDGDEYIAFKGPQIKLTSNRGTFNPDDPNILRGLIPAVGAGGLLALTGAEEAEAAVRPDIEDVIGKAIDGQAWAGRKAGSLESSVAKDALDGSAKYNGGDGYFTEHGLTWRNESNGWTPAQIAEGYRGIYDSPDTVVVPNVLGVNPSAKEALWNPNGKDSRSWYMPIAPYKKGFKGVTLYDPEASQVERLLKDRGYWEGGSTSSIFTPTLGERSKSIGSGTLSAVNSPSFENTIRGLEDWSKRNLPKVAGAATGAALPFLSPEEVEAERERYARIAMEQGLGSPSVDPIDILLAPIGAVGAGAKAAAMAAEPFISYGMDKAIGGLLDWWEGR